MATPHIAGLAALLFQAKPTASTDEIENAIFGSCTLTPGMFASRANRGYPDAIRALALLTGLDLTPSKGSKKSAKKSTTGKSTKAGKKKSSKKATKKR